MKHAEQKCYSRPTITGIGLAGLLLLTLIAGCTQRTASTYVHGALVRGDRDTKQIALIFTGGEHGDSTDIILNTLRDKQIKAAFFVTGDYLAKPGYHAHVHRMLAEGHYVGPHSHAHPLYCPWEDRSKTLITQQEFTRDLQRNIDELRELGALPPGQEVLFVPPYQWYNADQVRWSSAMDVTLINFTSGSGSNRDWIPESHPRFVSSEQIRDDILEYEHTTDDGLNGFLLLLHLGAQRDDLMHTQLEPLLRELQNRGYHFVRVDLASWNDT